MRAFCISHHSITPSTHRDRSALISNSTTTDDNQQSFIRKRRRSTKSARGYTRVRGLGFGSNNDMGGKEEEEERQTKNTIDFFSIVGKLKRTPRTGWTKYPEITSQVESVADHSFRIALMAFVFGLQQQQQGEGSLDVQKLVTIALVHDISESIVGDITPHCGISKEEKNRLEVEAMQKLKHVLGDVAGETIEALWLEYENGSSREARVVKELDKLEMLLQASEYENEYKDVDLTEFYSSCDGSFKSESGKRWVQEIMRRRPAR